VGENNLNAQLQRQAIALNNIACLYRIVDSVHVKWRDDRPNHLYSKTEKEKEKENKIAEWQ